MSCCVGNKCCLWEATNRWPFIAPFLKSDSLTAFYRHLLPMLPPLHHDVFVAASVCIVAQLIMVVPVVAANIEPPVCYPHPHCQHFVTVAGRISGSSTNSKDTLLICSPFLLIFFSMLLPTLLLLWLLVLATRRMIADVDAPTPQRWWHRRCLAVCLVVCSRLIGACPCPRLFYRRCR